MRRQGVTQLPGFLQTGEADPGRETDVSLVPETSYEGLETGRGLPMSMLSAESHWLGAEWQAM